MGREEGKKDGERTREADTARPVVGVKGAAGEETPDGCQNKQLILHLGHSPAKGPYPFSSDLPRAQIEPGANELAGERSQLQKNMGCREQQVSLCVSHLFAAFTQLPERSSGKGKC